MARNFIGDGFDLHGTIEAVPGLNSEYLITYRPATGLAAEEVASAGGAQARFDAKAKVIKAQMKQMVVVNDDGSKEAQVLTLEQFKALPAMVFAQLFNYVMGYTGPSVADVGNDSPAA